jgi:hypothetical protein
MVNIEESKVKVILALDQAKGPAPIGYVTQKTGLENPNEILRQLEEDGIVRMLPASSWSTANSPQFELTPKAKKLLQELIATRLEQLVEAGL